MVQVFQDDQGRGRKKKRKPTQNDMIMFLFLPVLNTDYRLQADQTALLYCDVMIHLAHGSVANYLNAWLAQW